MSNQTAERNTPLPTSTDVRDAELYTLRAIALALRDLLETSNGSEATLTLAGGTLVCDDDGCHLVPVAGSPVDLTEWIDYAGMVPA